jgi:hypothetical protein
VSLEVPRTMFVITAAVKGFTALGWISIFAVDFHAIQVHIATPLHNALLGALMVVTVGVVVRRSKGRDGTARTYSEGVVDGMMLTAGDPDIPVPRQGPGAKILYLRTGINVDPCTRRAPKRAGVRSSS